MYKAYDFSSNIEEISVIKDTSKTIHYTVKKIMLGEQVDIETDRFLLRKESKETDWYKYCTTKQEAKDWLLEKAKTSRQETVDKLRCQDNAIAEILEIEI
jgi:hypoxanthine phosphoribosyltransferase